MAKKAKLDEEDNGIVCHDDDTVEVEEGQSPGKKAKLAAATGGATVAKPVTKEDSELVCMDWSYLETLGAKRRVGPPRVRTTSCTSSNSAGEESKDIYINNSVPKIMDGGTSVHEKKKPENEATTHQSYDQKTVSDQNRPKAKKMKTEVKIVVPDKETPCRQPFATQCSCCK